MRAAEANCLFVTAHLNEAKALASALPGCRPGPLPFRYHSKLGKVRVSGQGMDAVRSTLNVLSFNGLSRAVLFGTAGSLTHQYRVGDLLLCDWIQDREGNDFASRLNLSLPRASLVSVNEPVSKREERRKLYEETGALLADMEGAAFGRCLMRVKIPWAVVKMVTDAPDEPHIFPFPDEIDTLLRQSAKQFVEALQEVVHDY